ncbi:MAG TPA: ketohexokinase [Gammaproteobacteria bacterium]|nr:ketohexokinase [Gammaproteobacteria bacterium]
MANILGVGIATLDIINYVAHYPEEDQELRASSQRISCGGNATNTLTVLSRLGHRTSLVAVLGEDYESGLIVQMLQQCKINISACERLPGKSPLSCILIAQSCASRTIVHYRDLPELSASAITRLDLSEYDWVHFEGRNIEQTRQMLLHTSKHYPDIRLSLEVEKPHAGISTLFAIPDVIFFSAPYVQSQGGKAEESWLVSMQRQARQAIVVCSDAARGAWVCDRDGKASYAPASAPDKLIDTLGAGDTFNAAMISALLEGLSLQSALQKACKLAGDKCGQPGLAGVGPAQHGDGSTDGE